MTFLLYIPAVVTHSGGGSTAGCARSQASISFPAELRVEVEEALVGLADEYGPNYHIWEDSVWLLYMWDSINPAADADWDWFREAVIGAAGFSIDDL